MANISSSRLSTHALFLLAFLVFHSHQEGVRLVNGGRVTKAFQCIAGYQCIGKTILGDWDVAPDFEGCGLGFWNQIGCNSDPIPNFGCVDHCAETYGADNVVDVDICSNYMYGGGLNWCFCCGA
ncbi:hypothetical protein MKW98_013440 [Papaver atlanticum]|uniref:Uncharacterized protein n=1 Tax=Papaver atlanticum TaxID=357466 RepID=A0AAD4SSM2_9MAGN|nr:hypothetical protein MKW98_013440 [Papaver atlanticum]